MKVCPRCGFKNHEKAWNCSKCKSDLRQPQSNPKGSVYGGESGTNLLLDAILPSSDRQTVRTQAIIEVTSHTVRLENDVYQFRNVTGFGVSNVKMKGIPFVFIFILLLLGLLTVSVPGLMSVPTLTSGAVIIWILFIGAVIYNLSLPKLYGLSLYLNSGNEIIFVTQNMDFLKHVVQTLKDFMENPKEGKIINVTIGRDVQGNITFGDVHQNL